MRIVVLDRVVAVERLDADRGCNWLQIVEMGLLQIVERWNITW